METGADAFGAMRGPRSDAAAGAISKALDRAARSRARALVMIVAASSEEEASCSRLRSYLADWERAPGGRVHCEGLGGGRYVVALAPIGFASHADEILAQLMCRIDGRPCPLEREAAPRFACGAAVYPEDGITPAQLLAHADAAMSNGCRRVGPAGYGVSLAAGTRSGRRSATRRSPGNAAAVA